MAETFSFRFTLAIAAEIPTKPTDAPITVEFTALTVTVLLSGKVIFISFPLFNVASSISAEALSIVVLSPIRALTEPP